MEEKSLVELFPNLFDFEEDELVKKSFSYSEKAFEEYDVKIEEESVHYAKMHIEDAEDFENAMSEIKYHFRNGAIWYISNLSIITELNDNQRKSFIKKVTSFYSKRECEGIFSCQNDISEEDASSIIEVNSTIFEDGINWAKGLFNTHN